MATKGKILFFLTLFLTNIFLARALIITEIMHDPEGADTDREWIEIYNDGSAAVDLSTYKFFEANTNHGLVSHQGGSILSPSDYAVIVDDAIKFLTDNPGYTGIIFDSSFSLSNTGEFLALKDGSGATKDSVTYSSTLGGENDGSTLSLIGGVWAKGKSTPGRVNEVSSVSVPVVTETEEATQNTNSTLPAAPTAANADISVIISEDKIVIAGADAEFKARAITSSRKNIENVEYEWSFGDGGTRRGKSVTYHYLYPGVYVAAVEAKSENAIAFAKTKIRVIPPELRISNLGMENGKNFVEVRNEGKFEVDLSSWKLDVNGGYYPFPKNTFILPASSIRFTGDAMGFAYATITPESKIRLLFPNLGVATSSTINSQTLASNIISPQVRGVSKTNISNVPPQNKTVNSPNIEIKKEVTKSATSTKPIQVTKRDRGLVSWFKGFFQIR